MNIMARDMAVAQACNGPDGLAGRFVSLPEPPPPQGRPPVAASLLGGRWLIQECAARGGPGSEIFLHLAGPAWSWADKIKLGAHVEQYVYVNASVDLQGQFRSSYDTAARVVSVWLQPAAGGRVEPIPGVHIQVETRGLSDLFPKSFIDSATKAEIESEGGKQLILAFSKGVTFTRTAAGQQDFALAHLAPGETPTRPFAGTEPWVVNQRQAFHSGGIMVDGPFPAGVPMVLDAFVAQGELVGYQAFCDDYVVADFNGYFQGRPFASLVNREGTTWLQPGQRITTTIAPPPGCMGRWVLAAGLPYVPPTPNLPPYQPPTVLEYRLRAGAFSAPSMPPGPPAAPPLLAAGGGPAPRATPRQVDMVDPNQPASVTARMGESVAIILPTYAPNARWIYTPVDSAMGTPWEDFVPGWLGPNTPGDRFTFVTSQVAPGDHVVMFKSPIPMTAKVTIHLIP
jgi:hypothetical protein